MWHEYPYTDSHELNLDWFLKEFKELMENWETLSADNAEFKQTMTENFNTLEGTVQNFVNFVNDYFNNLDVQQEINNKLDALVADGTLKSLLQPYFNELVASVTNSINTQNGRISTLEARMDTFASLTEGSTTGDAELMDIRVGADGITYASAGDAVRGQYTNNTNKIDAIDDVKHITDFTSFISGSLTFSESTPMITWAANSSFDFIYLYDVDYVRVSKSGYSIYVKTVSPDGTISETHNMNASENEYTITGKCNAFILRQVIISGTAIDIAYHKYDNPLKNVGVNIANVNAVKITNLTTDQDYMTISSLTRCLSQRIIGKNITVKCNPGYQVIIASLDDTRYFTRTPWSSGDVNYNDDDTVYYNLVIRKVDNADITADEALHNVTWTINDLSDEPEVVYFTTTVPINGTDYTDHGILVLPRNYTNNGTPVRLAIVCHGAGAEKYEPDFKVIDETGKILGDPQRVFTKMGFAVMDCYAAPYNFVGQTATSLGMHFGNPSVITCYQKAYEYVLDHYNIKKDGIILSGSSMGGLAISQIINSSIPVKAVLGYCPCLDFYKQAWSNPWVNYQRQNISRLFGFEGIAPTFTNTWESQTNAERQYFYDNIDKVQGLYPILYNATEGGFDDIKSYIPANASGDDAGEAAVYANFKALYKMPVLIQHCENDTTMAARYSKYFAAMLKKTGQRCKIILYPSGGHAAWAAGSDVTMTDVAGDSFTCKESQKAGYDFISQFE